jgi:hypothetical protein
MAPVCHSGQINKLDANFLYCAALVLDTETVYNVEWQSKHFGRQFYDISGACCLYGWGAVGSTTGR